MADVQIQISQIGAANRNVTLLQVSGTVTEEDVTLGDYTDENAQFIPVDPQLGDKISTIYSSEFCAGYLRALAGV